MKIFPDWFFNQVDWQEKTLKDLGYFYGGLSGKNKNDFGHGNADFITYMNVYKNNFADINQLEKVEIKENEKQNLVQYGDIFFTQSSETVEEIAMSSVWLHDKKTYLNSFCFGFRPNDLKILYPQFAGFLFRSESVRKKFILEGQGISRFNIAQSRIENIFVKIPSLAEQKKIADYFTHLDKAINAQEIKLQSWREVKKAMLQKIFAQEYFFTQDNGDKFPAWQEKTLGEVAEITSSKRIFVSEYVSEGVPFIRGQEISDNSISSSEKFNCYISEERYNEIKNQYGVPQKNDILITAVGTIGNLYLVEEDKKFYFKDGNIIWIKNFNQSIAPNYLKIFMQSFDFRNQILNFAMGGAQKALTIEKLFNAKIKIPCEEEQKKIAEYFSSLDRIIDAENKMLENLRLMKKGLLQKLFV